MESEGINILINSTVLLSIFGGACVFLLMYILRSLNEQQNVDLPKNEKHEHTDKKKDSGISKSKKKGSEGRWLGRYDKQTYSHPWLLTTMKGHTAQVLDMDFSSNGKYLASCAEDRTVQLWDVKDLAQKDRKSLRINIDFDHAKFVKWSPDSRAFIIHKSYQNHIEVFKVEKRKDGFFASATKSFEFPKAHAEDAIALQIACTGKFIMTCSNKTDLLIWDLRGQKLAEVDTYLMTTSCAKITPCGRFVVASGFAPDVKVWEVIFNKSGDFQEVKRIFDLTGHSSGVYDVAFDADTSHMATVSKDGTWKLYGTNVEYKRGEDPHLKMTGKYEQTSKDAKIALSPNAEVVVIGSSSTIAFYSTSTGQLDTTIDNHFNERITSLMFDSIGKHLFVVGDRVIRVFHNVTGYRCDIKTSKEKLKQNQTSATKERLQQIIRDSQTFLDGLNLTYE